MQNIVADLLPMYALPEEDANTFIKWVYNVRKAVNFDMDTIGYPRTCMTRAKMGDETVAMIPLHPVLFFESLVHKPELTAGQIAYSLWQIGQAVEKAMVDTLHREAYFITNSQPLADSCEKHGWVKAMFDPEKQTWLMKRKTEVAKLTSVPAEAKKCS